MTIHTITAFFDVREHADEAVTLLRKAGLPVSDVTLSPSDARDEFATFDPSGEAGAPKRKGFWGMLEDLFGGSDDHALYAEGVRRGSTMLTAHADDDHLEDVVEILDRHGSIDLDEREVAWRHDGWLGGSSGMPSDVSIVPGVVGRETAPLPMPSAVEPPPIITPASFAISSPVETPVDLPIASIMAADSLALSTPVPAQVDGGDVLQVVEERLVIGKRAVSRGKVRVHSYVVETPVSQKIQLRDETITVDRHAIDRVLSADALEDAGFRDRTIDMEEIDEEAVVRKTTRVVEEINVRKDVTNRVETVRETVRRTKVDIDDGRSSVAERGVDIAAEPFDSAGHADRGSVKPV